MLGSMHLLLLPPFLRLRCKRYRSKVFVRRAERRSKHKNDNRYHFLAFDSLDFPRTLPKITWRQAWFPLAPPSLHRLG